MTLDGIPDAAAHARTERGALAAAWRRANARNPEREVLWRSYIVGALWGTRGDRRRGIREGLDDAERAVEWPPLP